MKLSQEIIEQIKNDARQYFVGASGCHDWTHVERVCNLAQKIAAREKADPLIIQAAAYLHDIGRKEEMTNKGAICHAARGAELAQKILLQYNLDQDLIEKICHCILTHRYRRQNLPQTIEAKIIHDADKLDSIGAIGVARDFLFAGHSGSNCLYTGNEKKYADRAEDLSYSQEDSALLEYYYKLINIKDKILTQTGREIAQQRHQFMVDFFNRFEQEIDGLV